MKSFEQIAQAMYKKWQAALRTVLPWLPKPSKGWCCSTWAADLLFLKNADTFGVEKLYRWAKQNETKNEI